MQTLFTKNCKNATFNSACVNYNSIQLIGEGKPLFKKDNTKTTRECVIKIFLKDYIGILSN